MLTRRRGDRGGAEQKHTKGNEESVSAGAAQKKFWIGLSMWPEGEHAWLAHFHHGSFAWLQRFAVTGQSELQRLVADFHRVLTSEPAVSDIVWYEESQMRKAQPDGFATPIEG